MKNRKKRNVFIICLSFVLIFMGVGFSILSSNLEITSISNVAGNWKIVIDNINAIDNDTNAVSKSINIGSDGFSANLAVDFSNPGDYIEYSVTIKNMGSIKAVLESINITNISGPSNGIIATSNVINNTIIDTQESYTFKIKLEYPDTLDLDGTSTIYEFSLNVKQYEESGSSNVDIEEGQFYAVSSSNEPISISVPNNVLNRNKASSDGISYDLYSSSISIPKNTDITGYVLSDEEIVKVMDEYNNIIFVPEGFFINDVSTNVLDGVVIEDANYISGNQFVWIPVGTVKTDGESKTVTQGRYKFSKGSGDLDTKSYNPGDIVEGLTVTDYTQGFRTTLDTNSDFYNVLHYEYDVNNNTDFVKSTNLFKTSISSYSGFYFGRYEARNYSGTTINSINYPVYNNISQVDSFNKSDISRTNYSIALSNSTAWDTTTLFVQLFDNRADKTTPYSRVKGGRINTTLASYGTSDVICNIYDMSGNVTEWVASSNNLTGHNGSTRGGYYGVDAYTNTYMQLGDGPDGYSYVGFRQMLLLK